MERLTERIERYIEAYQLPPFGREVDGTVELLQEILKKLAHYEDAEKQGLLLRLPCKVGDTVYRISDRLNVRRKYIEKTNISRIAIDKDEIYVFCSCKPNVKRIFGVHVFSTKEEAEHKLKEMESDNNV